MKIKIAIIILALLSKVAFMYAQEPNTSPKDSSSFDLGEAMKKIFNTKVDMDVDKGLFNKQMGNIYFSEEYNAVLMTLVVPQTIETAAEHMEKESKKDGYKKIASGMYEIDGKKILFEKGRMKKNGKKMLIDMFVVDREITES